MERERDCERFVFDIVAIARKYVPTSHTVSQPNVLRSLCTQAPPRHSRQPSFSSLGLLLCLVVRDELFARHRTLHQVAHLLEHEEGRAKHER